MNALGESDQISLFGESTKRVRFWILALTFVWGFVLLMGFGKSRFLSNEWIQLLGYPCLCWFAAGLLLRGKREVRLLFVGLNFAAGVGWIIFVYWAVTGFARSFWR